MSGSRDSGSFLEGEDSKVESMDSSVFHSLQEGFIGGG